MTQPITLREARDAGFCVKGQREFLNASGVDWRDYVRNGIEVDRALSLDGWAGPINKILAKRETRG